MKTWITSDWHLGETRMAIMGRPFESANEMVETLITNHNKLVAPGDTVYVNGDVCYDKAPEFLSHVARFNGNKILIRGNHDRVFFDYQLEPYFVQIIEEGGGLFHTVDNIRTYITHYPTRGYRNIFNLVGHIHGAWKIQFNMLNVGVDVHHFRPINMEIIPAHMNSLYNFYDDDAWIAYNDINAAYQGIRGKKGSRFP